MPALEMCLLSVAAVFKLMFLREIWMLSMSSTLGCSEPLLEAGADETVMRLAMSVVSLEDVN
jgi:hypothetical protein